MRRTLTFLATAIIGIGATLFVAAPAQAHGYISSPASRQAMCAQGRVPNCGDIVYEPQSVEGPKGLRSCSGGNARFAQLDDESKPWPATSVGNTVTFTWSLTARHSTSTWEYYIGGTRIAVFDDHGAQPPATVSHSVSLGGRTGRQKVLAIWNVADTANAFYACVDLQVGGGGTPSPTPTPSPRPTPSPTPTRTPSPSPTPTRTPTPTPTIPGGTWAAGTAYKVGDRVTYGGVTYRCIQAHTALVGWEPPNVPALWQKV
ncbi:lytic polysaccharide monooxygenase [Microbispora bryophytorum]|uniref:Cellulose-binding protein n=1 Tax=Microbispora bryophytorum TaxID=1460882 RepID=A0A8H9H5K1_9ACTN|nr:lytic polysaccharide monooxygenase [Microbispora bryophytorum]MBD3140884.1 lytic polysaccharide monooxygenase [Microbispora bryophytorum]TQS02121.1 cellulose-binding protein [Microbispora bryophytorum]GGO29356.1 cellulose-binding protein [Microbispora bryophytorum]